MQLRLHRMLSTPGTDAAPHDAFVAFAVRGKNHLSGHLYRTLSLCKTLSRPGGDLQYGGPRIKTSREPGAVEFQLLGNMAR